MDHTPTSLRSASGRGGEVHHCPYILPTTHHSSAILYKNITEFNMDLKPIQPNEIAEAVSEALQPLAYVHAMWQGGAVAFDRVDRFSDLDLMIVVDDERVEETFHVIEASLGTVSPIARSFRLPQPTWHGHDQAFYRLDYAGPYLLVDAVVMKLSSPNRFLQPEIHGNPLVYFDKCEVVSFPEFDWEAHNRMLAARVETLNALFELFQPFIVKELERGQRLEALAYYHGLTLRPLVELLRICHAPARYNFQSRYIYHDLPRVDVERLERLYFPRDPVDLRLLHREARDWFRTLIADREQPDGEQG
jgi:hypothetical protein